MSKQFIIQQYPCRQRGKYANGVAVLSAKRIKWMGPKRSNEDQGRRTTGDAPTVIWKLESLKLGRDFIPQDSDIFQDVARWLKGKQAEIDRAFYEDYL